MCVIQTLGSTALRVASASGQSEIVRVLIARGATVDHQDMVRQPCMNTLCRCERCQPHNLILTHA